MTQKNTILITGGGTGIGFALAKLLDSQGCSVWICGRRAHVLDDIKEILPSINSFRCDVSVKSEVDSLFKAISKTTDTIDCLVNNAAILQSVDYKTMDFECIKSQFEVNSLGPLLCVQNALSFMSNGGRVVNISSKAALDPFPGLEVYGMTKAALEPLTVALNREDGIEAVNVFLGAVDTAMLRSFLPNYTGAATVDAITLKIANYILNGEEIVYEK